MSSPGDVSNSTLPGDSGFLAALMPNRGRTRFLRGVLLLFLGAGVLGSLSVGVRVFGEFHARRNWPVAPGVVTGREVKSNKGLPGNLTRETRFWVEYEVRFHVPVAQCLTGIVSADPDAPMPCWGRTRTRATTSWADANAWMARHKTNSAIEVLHDPQGPSVKIAGESPWLVYPWRDIFLMLIWMIFFAGFFCLAQRRLRYLETLPEDFDATPPSSPEPPDPHELTDLKLS